MNVISVEVHCIARAVLNGTSPHLSREQVAALLPLLQRFVDTGRIGPNR